MGDQQQRYLFALGYPDEALADAALSELHELRTDNYLEVTDWAIVTKSPDGKVKTRESTGSDAGAARGAVAGGVVGALLVLAGPIGWAGAAAATGVGALAAVLHDGGLKEKDLESVAGLMRDGRTVLVLTVTPEFRERMHQALTEVPELAAADPKVESPVDGSTGNVLREAVEQYRSTHADT
jgi:uncharacterized membrane protein